MTSKLHTGDGTQPTGRGVILPSARFAPTGNRLNRTAPGLPWVTLRERAARNSRLASKAEALGE